MKPSDSRGTCMWTGGFLKMYSVKALGYAKLSRKQLSLSTQRTCVREINIEFHSLLTWALDGGEWLASGLCCFASKETPPPPR
jgi:hypothetical protein